MLELKSTRCSFIASAASIGFVGSYRDGGRGARSACFLNSDQLSFAVVVLVNCVGGHDWRLQLLSNAL